MQATQSGGKQIIVVSGNTDVGVLCGAFALLPHLSCNRTIQGLFLTDSPKVKYRILKHWDNLDGTVERGYAGESLWQWSSLPGPMANAFRPYGIKVYLSAQFGAPKQIGNLSTADPSDSSVKRWWITEANTSIRRPRTSGLLGESQL